MINLFRGHIFRLGVLAGAALVALIVLTALVLIFWRNPPWVRVEVGSRLSPGQIGMLRWYESGMPIQVTLDQHPAGIAFDRNNFWIVADPADDSETKNGMVYQLDPHSLSLTQVYPVEREPRGVVFDGAHLWVANSGSKSVSCIPITNTVSVTATVSVTVSQVSETDTAIITRTVGLKPYYLAFDGDYVWVTNRDDNTLSRLSARTCAGSDEDPDLQIPNETQSKELDKPPFNQPFGIAFDGEFVWVTNRGGTKITRILAKDPTSIKEFEAGQNPYGVAFDGEHVWVALNGEDKVVKLRASDGKRLGKYDVGHRPWGVAFDGTNIWVANNADGTITKLRASDGTLLGTFDTGSEASLLAFDGVYMWVTNYGDNSLTRR